MNRKPPEMCRWTSICSHAALVVRVRRPEDEQHRVRVVVDLRALAELARVLERERMQPEQRARGLQRVRRRLLEIEPEELVVRAQRLDPRPVDLGQDLHRRPTLPGSGRRGRQAQATSDARGATGSSDRMTRSRPRARRDITVPTGTESACAASL